MVNSIKVEVEYSHEELLRELLDFVRRGIFFEKIAAFK